MTDGSFADLGEKITGMIRSPDPRPLLEFISFPFSFVEDELTIILKNESDLVNLHRLIAPAVRRVARYDISGTSVVPIGSVLYLASFQVEVGFVDGTKLDPSKRAVILGDRDGAIKAISGISLLQCCSEWMAENDPQNLAEVRKWAS